MDNDVLRNPQARFEEQKDNPIVKGLIDFIQQMYHSLEDVFVWQIYEPTFPENDYSRSFSVTFKDNTGLRGTMIRHGGVWVVRTYNHTLTVVGCVPTITVQGVYGGPQEEQGD